MAILLPLLGSGCAEDTCSSEPYPGPGNLRTQAEVDALEGYIAAGTLVFTTPEVTSLESLRCLREVSTLQISGTGLKNLDGLNHLLRSDFLGILGNEGLENLSALSSLEQVDTSLVIYDNPMLTSVEGLSSLQVVNEMSISFSAQLLDLDGLSSLNYVGGQLAVFNNPALETVSGMKALEFVGSGLIIENNDSLEPCDDLRLAAQVEVVNGEHLLQSDPADCPGL